MKTRIAALVVIVLIPIILSGCMRLDVRTGVDASNNAYLLYDLEIDLMRVNPDQRASLIDGIKNLEDHFRDTHGFEVFSSESSESYSMKALLTVQGSDYEDAYAKLRTMLSDEEITPFSELSMDYATAEMQQLYLFSGAVDMAGILASSNIGELPPSMKENIEELFRSSTGTLTIELPGSEATSALGETEINGHHISLTKPLDFSGETQVELTTRLNTGWQLVFTEPMEEVVSTFRMLGYVGFGLAGLGAVLAVVAIVRMRSKKAQKTV